MRYIYDIHVNWVHGGSSLNYIPECFEWMDSDDIKELDSVLVVKITSELYNYIERDYGELPEDLLKHVCTEELFDDDGDLVPFNGIMVVTDGVQVLAINTEDTNEPFFKSRVPINEENFILKLSSKLPTFESKVKIPKKKEKEKDNSLLGHFSHIVPEYMVGLTRQERELKLILFDLFFEIACSTNVQQVRYWYVEMFPYEYEQSKNLSQTQMLTKMFDEIRFGWGETHARFGNELVKTSEVFNDLWKDIVKIPDVKRLPRTRKIKF